MVSLKFGHGDMSGFTAYATASFNDTPPAKVVRELLQNALDAGVAAGERTTRVRFEVVRVTKTDIPDISGYEDAFRAAVRDNRKVNGGRLTDAAQHVVDTIERALRRLSDEGHCMLRVLDSGVGLDRDRMTSLLGDGSSVKEDGLGSYGVGHFAAVSASDLRYLLYGGATKQGRRTAAGFAILAGRFHKKQPLSGRGYLVKKLLGGDGGRLYRFMGAEEIPSVLGDAIDTIKREWRHGTAVLIPAFNYFGRPPGKTRRHDDENSWLSAVVTRVAAYNFSAAIWAGDLSVEVDERATGGTTARLDKRTLPAMLERDRERVRRFRSDSAYHGLRPSGQAAWAAYQTLAGGASAQVPTPSGSMSVHLSRQAPAGATRLDLFRNGMWITDDLPELGRGDFADRKPFHAVLSPAKGNRLHRLVRKAEGTMHDQLVPSLLGDVEQEQLRTAFRAVAAYLRTQVPQMDGDTYTPDDFLVVSTGGDGGTAGTTRYEMWGSPVVVQGALLSQRRTDDADEQTDVEPDDGPGGSASGRRKKRRSEATRRSRPLPFRCTAVPGERGAHSIELECHESIDEVLLRFRIDENIDATCDRLWPDEAVAVRSFEAKDQSGVKLPGRLEDDGATVRLRGLTPGKHQVSIKYDVPAGFDDQVQSPVFRVDLHRQ